MKIQLSSSSIYKNEGNNPPVSTVYNSKAKLAEVGIQHICPVPAAVHPAIDDCFWTSPGWGRCLAKIFSTHGIHYSIFNKYIKNVFTLRSIMGKIIPVQHILASGPCNTIEYGIGIKKLKAAARSYRIDQVYHLGLNIAYSLCGSNFLGR